MKAFNEWHSQVLPNVSAEMTWRAALETMLRLDQEEMAKTGCSCFRNTLQQIIKQELNDK